MKDGKCKWEKESGKRKESRKEKRKVENKILKLTVVMENQREKG